MRTALMTQQQAHERARERWPGFSIWTRVTLNPRAPFQIGIIVHEGGRAVHRCMGIGLTWERAFISADNREQRPHARRCRAVRGPRLGVRAEQFDLFAHGCADATLHRG